MVSADKIIACDSREIFMEISTLIDTGSDIASNDAGCTAGRVRLTLLDRADTREAVASLWCQVRHRLLDSPD